MTSPNYPDYEIVILDGYLFLWCTNNGIDQLIRREKATKKTIEYYKSLGYTD